jgi:hypothetical protein
VGVCMCGCVYVWVCNVWVCVCVGGGCCNVLVFLTTVWVFW